MRRVRDPQRGSSDAVLNSRGYTNGLQFSDPSSQGKVNGLGFLRKGGFTNGVLPGFSNGRTNGRTNGKTNGRTNGRINGINGRNGLVNGLTNGITNGVTNGRRLRARPGRTNGITNGFVNGSGAVNGFRLSYQQRRFKSRTVDFKKRFVIIAVLVMLVVAVPYALVYSFPKENVTIDGNFLDWIKAQIYRDTPDSTNPDISLTEYSMKHDNLGSYFYIETQGQLFTGRDGGADAVDVFVDIDNNPLTGYSVRGIGADMVTEIVGWNGTVQLSDTMLFNSTASRHDFAGFEYAATPTIAVKGGKMEFSTPIRLTDSSQVVVLMRSTDAKADWSDVTFRSRGPAIEVVEDHDAPDVIVGTGDRHVLSVDISGKGPMASIPALRFDFLGNMTPTFIKAVQGGQIIGATSDNVIRFVQPLQVSDGETKVLDILADFPIGYSNYSFGLKLNSTDPLGVDGNVSWYVDSVQTGAEVSYIGSAPTTIAIDGAFADWSSRVPIQDNLGDAYSSRTNDSTSGNVDINTVKVASTTDVASFYMSVNGTMLAGTSVPASLVRFVSPGGPAENITPIKEPMYGADFAFVFLDTDRNQSTGYQIGGAESAIAIYGKGNSILSSRAFRFVSGGWVDAGPADAAIDQYQLEVSGNYSELGLVPGETYTVTFMMEDWSGRTDDIATALPARVSAGTRAYGGMMINEVYSQTKKPHDWVELYNTALTPIDISGWTLWIDGLLVFTFPSGTIVPSGGFYVTPSLDFGANPVNFVLMNGGSIVDTMSIPNWDNSNSWGRTGAPPYGTIMKMNPTPGKLNRGQVAIPEFQDLLLPITIMPFMLFVIRRARGAKKANVRRN